MFKIFKNRVCSFTFTLFILFFVQTIEGNASFVKNQFQERVAVTISTLEKNVTIKAVDRAVIQGVEEQDGIALGKVEKTAAFSGAAFWGGIGILSLLASLCVGDVLGAVVSLWGIFTTL
ncbi:hypothetical protein [Bartonella grahamii]|uniref:Uncharacterized protein n=2 Tax=Bartonella grahamii TaxID=33045 RepID=A0A336NAY4_BARGR|nr:hypothetical protein [Bartonella grahamii]ACS51757.1 hypothetical membrane protein [Bartonella grahamii as4aup]SSZ39255.1 Uncharacterised protein [Bartonella grahamii]